MNQANSAVVPNTIIGDIKLRLQVFILTSAITWFTTRRDVQLRHHLTNISLTNSEHFGNITLLANIWILNDEQLYHMVHISFADHIFQTFTFKHDTTMEHRQTQPQLVFHVVSIPQIFHQQ